MLAAALGATVNTFQCFRYHDSFVPAALSPRFVALSSAREATFAYILQRLGFTISRTTGWCLPPWGHDLLHFLARWNPRLITYSSASVGTICWRPPPWNHDQLRDVMAAAVVRAKMCGSFRPAEALTLSSALGYDLVVSAKFRGQDTLGIL